MRYTQNWSLDFQGKPSQCLPTTSDCPAGVLGKQSRTSSNINFQLALKVSRQIIVLGEQ